MATLTISRAVDTSGNPQTGYLLTNDGQVLYTMGSDITIAVNPGNIVVFNKNAGAPVNLPSGVTTADGFTNIPALAFKAIPGPNQTGGFDITQDAYADLVNVGQVSDAPDPHSGHYYIIGYHHGSHTAHGQHISRESVSQRHTHKNTAAGHHHRDVVFSLTSGNPATLTWTAGTVVDNNGNTIGNVAANGVGLTVYQNDILYYDSVANTYGRTGPSTIDFKAHTSNRYHMIGNFGAADEDGYLKHHGWHTTIHQIGPGHIRAGALHGGENGHKDHHAPKSHSRRHDQTHKPGRHHHHNGVMLEFNGTTLTVTGGTTDLDDGSNWVTLGSTTISGFAMGDWIVCSTSTSGTQYPYRVANGQWTESGNDGVMVMARVGPADADGNLTTEGWHHGPHKTHEKHIKSGAVRNKHMKVINGYYTGQVNVAVASYNQWNTTTVTFNWKQVFSEAQLYANICGINSGGGNSETYNASYQPVVLWNPTPGATIPSYGTYSIISGTVPAGSQIVVTSIQINPGDPATAGVTIEYYVTNTGTVQLGVQFLLATGVS